MGARRILLICGRRLSGKDTLADMLVERSGFIKLHVATPIKKAVGDLFSLTHEQLHGPAKDAVDPAWGVTPRRILQVFGTELMQHRLSECVPGIGRTFWVRRLVRDIRALGCVDVVVADVRFLHEIAELQLAFPGDVRVVHVQRHGPRDAPSGEDAHESESTSEGLPVDARIDNNGTLADLWAAWCAVAA
jgi:hypothetical protein